jgi:predicted O-methyltransferase YrrM
MADVWSKEYNTDILIVPEDSLLKDFEGGVTHGECVRLSYLASLVKSDLAIVEIGSFRGKSACFLGAGSRHGNGAKIYAIDPWDINSPYSGATKEYWNISNKEEFDRHVEQAKLGNIVTGIKNFSVEEAKKWNKPIGLLHIDGNHSDEGVKSDYNAWFKHVVKGGTIAFHDYNLSPVKKFVEEVVKPSGLLAGWNLYGRLLTATKK